MRRFDKSKNIKNANLLAEQRYLASKGLISEGELPMGDISRDARSVEFGIPQYQEEPELTDLGQLTPNQKQMKEYISKYVTSELELNHEMKNYIENGYQGLSDNIKDALRNDGDYQTWVQMSHDEDTFRRERGGIPESKYDRSKKVNEFEFDMPRKPVTNDDMGKFEERDRMKHRLEAKFNGLSLINSEDHNRRNELGDGNLVIQIKGGNLQPEIENQIRELANTNGWGFESFMDGLYLIYQGDSYGNKYQGSLDK